MIESPTGDTIRRGDTESEQDSAHDLENAELGALHNTVFELPNICPPCGVDVAVSGNAAPTTCWDMLQGEACIRISSVADDILHSLLPCPHQN